MRASSTSPTLSRISAQHHRCNGKSFQYPSNTLTFSGQVPLWVSALLNCPCGYHYAALTGDCKPISTFVKLCSKLFDSASKAQTNVKTRTNFFS